MNAMTIPGGESVTMTSLELVEFINSQRGEGEAELRHDHFMAKVPKVLGETAPKFLGTDTYTSGKGATSTRAIYRFPKREACLMAMSYSYDLQARVFDRMTALEAQVVKPAVSVDLNNPASLRQLLLGYTEKVIALEQTVAQQAPKVEYAEALLGSEDTMRIGDAAKSVGLLVRRTFTALREKGVLLRDNTPAAEYVNKGYFKEVPSVYRTPDGETRSRPQARVTSRGLEFLRRFGKRHPEIRQSTH